MGAELKIPSVAQAAWETHRAALSRAMDVLVHTAWGSPEAEAAAEEARQRYMLAHEGTFRDSYNATNVLLTLGLSWGQHVLPLVGPDCMLRGEALDRVVAMVEGAKQEIPLVEELASYGPILNDMDLMFARGDKEQLKAHPSSPDAWREHFREKRMELINFLRRAVEKDEGVFCGI